MKKHILRCPSCKQTGEYAQVKSPKNEPCVMCGFNFINCGPLPRPDWTIPSASALSPELSVYTPPPMSAEDIPKWACPWCGRNVGATKRCKRCACDLTQVAPISLRDWARGFSPKIIGEYCSQAMHPMDGAVAVIRLYRLDPETARARRAAESLVKKMRKIPPPPGVNLRLDETRSAIGQKLDNQYAHYKGEENYNFDQRTIRNNQNIYDVDTKNDKSSLRIGIGTKIRLVLFLLFLILSFFGYFAPD